VTNKLGKITFLAIAIVFLVGANGCLPSSDTSTTDQTNTSQLTNGGSDSTYQQNQQVLSGDNLLTIDPNTLSTEIAQGKELADTKAKEWQNNAKLVAVQIEVPASLKKTSVSTRYIFNSLGVSTYYWTIALTATNENYVRALIPKEDYLASDLKVILEDFWKINYAQALQATEENGGSTWRETHNLGGATLVLSRGQPNSWLYWQIEYIALNTNGERSPVDNFKLRINAYTGEVAE